MSPKLPIHDTYGYVNGLGRMAAGIRKPIPLSMSPKMPIHDTYGYVNGLGSRDR